MTTSGATRRWAAPDAPKTRHPAIECVDEERKQEVETMRRETAGRLGRLFSVGLVVSCVALAPEAAAVDGTFQSTPRAVQAGSPAPAAPAARAVSSGAPRFGIGDLSERARLYYRRVWGIDILGVKPVSSGMLVRFSYRVVDANLAQALNDERASAVLIDDLTGAQLVVPQMENVGKLRQTTPPENGREYWVLFSNKGNYVRPGSRVDVVIGKFHAGGLIVGPTA